MDLSNKAREEELIRSFKSGKKTAFDELVILYSPKLYKVAFSLLGSRQDAEEVVQDAFVRAYRALADFRGDASFETWMHRITINLARNRYHWNLRRGEGMNMSLSALPGDDENDVHEFDLPDTRQEPDLLLQNEELESNIVRALKQLPDALRETMILRHLNDMAYEQIADRLDCKVGTVKSRLARGREMLRSLLLELELPSAGKSGN